MPAKVTVKVNVTNTGSVKADEIAELYIDKDIVEKGERGLNENVAGLAESIAADNQPVYSLAGFERVSLNPGETAEVTFEINERDLETVLEDGTRVFLSGSYKFFVGGQQPDKRSEELTGKKCLEARIDL